MSGPDYYRLRGGDNVIGLFQIGVSPIGTITPFDYWQTIISQYANSPVLTTLISDFFAVIDQTKNMDTLFDLIRNLDTAQGYGLDVWGRIVGINRVLKISGGLKFFGFDEGGTLDYDPFNQSPFYSGQKLTENFLLADDGFRVLILAKAFSNICDGSIASINRILVMLFGRTGRCYVIDNLDMTLTYKFDFALSPVDLSIVTNSGVLPRPVGVEAIIVQGP